MPALFTNARILQQLGHARLAQFLDVFEADLKAMNLFAPPPLPPTHFYFTEVADFLSSDPLPSNLTQAMVLIESAASPENSAPLASLLQDYPECSDPHPLASAVSLWLAAPQLLSALSSAVQSSAVICAKSRSLVGIQGSTIPASPDRGQSPARSSHEPASGKEDSAARESSNATNYEPLTTNQAQKSKIEYLHVEDAEPWPEPVSIAALLDELAANLSRFVVLPPYAATALALWVPHTYAWQLRDVTTYIGIESPEKQCGKTTLLAVLSELVNRAVAASNVSPPAFFRVIQDLAPTLLIDEGDTFLRNNDQLRGIFNAGYKRKTAFDLWLSHQLRPYGIRSRNIIIEGTQAKGYWLEEFKDTFRRYIPQSEFDALKPFDPPPPDKSS